MRIVMQQGGGRGYLVGLLIGWLLVLPSWAIAPLSNLDSTRQFSRWPLATQLRLTQAPHIVPATASIWEALARRTDLARSVQLNILSQLAGYYIAENQPSLAISQMLEVMRLAPHDTARCSSSGMWICYCYYLLRQPKLGLPYGQLAIHLLRPRQPADRHQLEQAYALLGSCASLLPDLALAQHYYTQELHLDQAGHKTANIAVGWTNLATLSLKQNQLMRAARQLDSARHYLALRPRPSIQNIVDELAGNLALRQHRYAAAAAVLKPAWQYSYRTRNRNAEVAQLKLLAEAELPLGHTRAAIRYQQRLLLLQDSLFEQASYQRAQELQALYQSRRKEQQLAQQQQHIAALQLRAAESSRRTTGLIGLLLGVGLVLAGLLLRQRTRRQLATAAEALRVRNRIAADLHDEVGTLLTRVSMQAELLAQTQTTPNGAFDRLLTNSRAAARTMRDIVWSIDAEADTIGALLDRMRDHLDQTAAPIGLQTVLHVQGLADTDPLPGDVRQHLYLIFKEAVTNAARHACGATQLHVQLHREAATLVLSVTDNGHPTAASPRSSMGLRNMRQRAQALGGELQVGPIPSGGFQVWLRIF